MVNITASVRARLANRAQCDNQPFQQVLQYYGLERFLYRFSQLEQRNEFILKGALMLRVWNAPITRPTRDIDLLAFSENSVTHLEAIMRDACEVIVPEDGLRFDPLSVSGSRIKEDSEYEGVRVRFGGFLDKARIPMQIDVGFGDIVYPKADKQSYPTILDFPAPILRTYPRETVIAEKFHAMVILGSLNSRLKDFFDIWLLANQYDFEGSELARAIQKTFERRETRIDPAPVALASAFTSSERVRNQWTAFVRRSSLAEASLPLDEIWSQLERFLIPPAQAAANRTRFDLNWTAPGPWN